MDEAIVARSLLPHERACEPDAAAASMESRVRRMRLWYHDIEVAPGIRTRFPDDYDVNPVLRSVDECAKQSLTLLDEHLPHGLAGMSVLDLGCADGLLAIEAARRGSRRVLGIERNRPNFDRAEFLRDSLHLENTEFRWGSVERCLVDEPFDFVFCFGLIYHLVNPLGTLNLIRSCCCRKMILTSAIDLDDGAGVPLQRLDRYATGAHGLWAFNAHMIRQMLSTAGFEITEETIEDLPGGRHYVAVVQPGSFAKHHIFDETIDQEFPINVDHRREKIRDTLCRLVRETDKPIALFGAGNHTSWLLKESSDVPGLRIACILDDRIPMQRTVRGVPVILPSDADPKALGAIVLSSWHQSAVLQRRAEAVFGDCIPIVTFDS